VFKFTVIVGAMIIVQSLPSYGNEITVQGVEMIDETIYTLEAAIVHIDALDSDQAGVSIEQAEEFWNTFKEHHDFVYENELTPSEEIWSLISVITSAIENIVSTCGEIIDKQDTREVHTAIEELGKLKNLCTVPVLLDFTGALCKSCKVMKDRLQTVANDVTGSARVVIIDVNSQKKYSKEFKVMLIPTLVFIDTEGEEVERHVGEMEVQAVIAELVKLSE